MTPEQIIYAKYERLFIALFDNLDWERIKVLFRIRQQELDNLKTY